MAAPKMPFNVHRAIQDTEDEANIKSAEILSLEGLPRTEETLRQEQQFIQELGQLQAQLRKLRALAGQADSAPKKRPGSGLPHREKAPADQPAMLVEGQGSAGVTPTSAHRKRSISSSHLDPATGRPESKSRKPSPIAWGKASATNDDLLDSARLDVVDLTGDDDAEWKLRLKRQRDEENRLALKKQNEARDAKLARELAGRYGSSSSAGTFSQGQPLAGGADAFARMRNQSRGYPTPASGSAQHLPNSSQAWNPGSLPMMPGPSGPSSQLGRANVQSGPSMPGSFGAGFSGSSYTMPGSYPTFDTINPQSLGITNSHAPQPGVPDRTSSVLHGSLSQPLYNVGSANRNPFAQTYGAQPVYGNENLLDQPVYMTPQHTLNQGFQRMGYHSSPAAPQRGAMNRPGYIVNGVDPLRLQPASSLSSIYRAGGLQANELMDYTGLNPNIATYVNDLLADPRKTEEEIGELLSNIRPDMEIPVEERGTTPEALKYPLYPHQILALGWMSKMEEGSNKGGILADDMGLGKTISTLALMVSRKSQDPGYKTNLIIGPVALVKQWQSEIDKKLKGAPHNLGVCLLHMKKLTWPQLKMFDVVLTTYGSIGAEWKRYEKHVLERQKSSGYDAAQDEQLHRLCPLLHPKSKFYRVILDEAQYIKNYATLSSNAAAKINATYRWCLTGTPMMNGAQELGPLIRFLHIKPYENKQIFNKAFESLYTSKGKKRWDEATKERALGKLQVLLKAIMLRRTKTSEIDGRPILTLPPKTEIEDHVVFSPDEDEFYKSLEANSVVTFRKFMRAGTVGKHYSAVLTLLLRLRQACCHPHLLDFEVVGTAELPEDRMIALAQGLEASVVERVKAIEDFQCPICYDAVADPTIIIPCGHDTCSECFVSLSENAAQDSIMAGNDDNNRNSAKCPVCRGEARSDSIVNYRTFQKVHMPDKVPQASKLLGAPSFDDSDSDSGSEYDSDEYEDDTDDDADANGNLRDFIVDDDAIDSDDDGDDERDDFKIKKDAEDEDSKVKGGEDEETKVKDGEDEDTKVKVDEKKDKKKKKRVAKARLGKKKVEKVHAHQLGDLRKASVRNKKARSQYMHYLRDNWEDSAKVTRVIELLSDIQTTGEKTIIFSQWTALLDLIECRIKSKLGLGYCRYTGSMSRTDRDKSVQDFINTDKFPVMLVSLRAGNAGLNLVAASNVIICDPFWNPYIEMQAIDRAHRIGQQRPVKVYRILVKDTVEDRILELQQKKRDIIDAAMDEGQAKNLGRLSTRDLLYLFGGGS